MSSPCKVVLMALGLLAPLILQAQRIRTVSGEYIYYPPETQTMEAARMTAEDRAKIQILADEFGTVLQSSVTTRMEQSASGSAISTSSLSSSDVRGEWIETTDGPHFTTLLSPDGLLGIKVSISGRVREITEARTDIQAIVLRNGTDLRFADNAFKDGDDLFLRFRSPEDGWLLVYLYDGAGQVYCLLPYSTQRLPSYPVKALQDYVFFSAAHPDGNTPASDVDEYTLTSSRAQEMNRLYVLFSPNRFARASDNTGSAVLPRELPFKQFQQYLGRALAEDRQLVVRDYLIEITKQ